MRSLARLLLTSTVLALALVAFAPKAQAIQPAETYGYVCEVDYFPSWPQYGSFGYLQFSLNTAPDCTAIPIGTFTICSANSTLGICAYPALLPATDAQMMAIYQALVAAANSAAGYSVAINYTGSGVITSLGIRPH
jgi:hypothetical protein